MNMILAQDLKIISILEIYDLDLSGREVIYQKEGHFEAPNWSPDGKYLLFNSNGLLYKWNLDSNNLEKIDTDFATQINNDHGISPDGNTVVISCPDPIIPGNEADNWLSSKIYTLPSGGGVPKLITKKAPSFWHGWSPDGKELAYVAKRKGDFDIYTIGLNGGEETRLTSEPGLDDGPEYSPDGKFIYYNSFSSGSMEIWRMDRDGNNKKQITSDKYSNWFPHPSPNSQHLVYLSYQNDQGEAHPPLKEVALKLYDIQTKSITKLCSFTGGQGTINVPSWHPKGRKFAFVSYEIINKGIDENSD